MYTVYLYYLYLALTITTSLGMALSDTLLRYVVIGGNTNPVVESPPILKYNCYTAQFSLL